VPRCDCSQNKLPTNATVKVNLTRASIAGRERFVKAGLGYSHGFLNVRFGRSPEGHQGEVREFARRDIFSFVRRCQFLISLFKINPVLQRLAFDVQQVVLDEDFGDVFRETRCGGVKGH
jgi:hypothetical protein